MEGLQGLLQDFYQEGKPGEWERGREERKKEGGKVFVNLFS